MPRRDDVVQSKQMKRDLDRQKYQSLDPRKYAGKYVVIVAGKLIGAGRDLGKLLTRARKEHPKEVPFVGRMRDPRRFYVYCSEGWMCSIGS